MKTTFRTSVMHALLCALVLSPHLVHAQNVSQSLVSDKPLPGAIWLEDLDWAQHAEHLVPRQSVKKTPLTINERVFPHGFGGEGRAQLLIQLDGRAARLVSAVGIDDVEKSKGNKIFEVWLDDRMVSSVGPLLRGEMQVLDVDLKGAHRLELAVAHGGKESDWDRFVLGGAQIVLANAADAKNKALWPKPYSLEPEATRPIAHGPDPRTFFNGPRVVGGTPGRPFAHRLAVSGQAPVRVTVSGLPRGLRYDAASRILQGRMPEGRFKVVVQAAGPGGKVRDTLTLVGAHTPDVKALTPIMGWNSWNLWAEKVTGEKIRAAADAMRNSGLADYGFSYVNIDDAWEGKRDECGRINPNENFGDMATLAQHVHKLGLKLGIYSSPGPQTCAKYPGSYGYEATDARRFAEWGIDLLKYDWCTYDKITPNFSIEEQRRPYHVMQLALDRVDRDIVYSVCNYGRGDVWTWGKSVGGNLWRTTSDITDTWSSLEGIAFSQQDKAPFTQPGHVGDMDMLVVGTVGWGKVRPTRLSGNEQILHITHWAMMASPLLLGCDLMNLDPFTLDLLTNSEVLAIDQDARVEAATRRLKVERTEVWARPLADGGMAVALYNRGQIGTQVTADLAALGVSGTQEVRDLWQRKNLEPATKQISAFVPQHGAVLLKLKPQLGRPAGAPMETRKASKFSDEK